MRRRQTTSGTMMMLAAAVTAAAIGCGGKFPKSPASSSCGDQCASLSCPAGSHCVLKSNCTPTCEQEMLTPAR
jgi:hypothetical protein